MADVIILEKENVLKITMLENKYYKIFLKENVVVDNAQKQKAAVIRVLRDVSCLDIINVPEILQDVIDRCRLNILRLQLEGEKLE